jgi:hypothetical protein
MATKTQRVPTLSVIREIQIKKYSEISLHNHKIGKNLKIWKYQELVRILNKRNFQIQLVECKLVNHFEKSCGTIHKTSYLLCPSWENNENLKMVKH